MLYPGPKNSTAPPRLAQLRINLEASVGSMDGLSGLYTIRRQLLRHYHAVSLQVLTTYPVALRHRFEQTQKALSEPATFPAPDADQRYADTDLALGLLEQLAL
jgi:hypothetical protein